MIAVAAGPRRFGRSCYSRRFSPFNPEVLRKDVLNSEDLSRLGKERYRWMKVRRAFANRTEPATPYPGGFLFCAAAIKIIDCAFERF
jgi:hypothetical protein